MGASSICRFDRMSLVHDLEGLGDTIPTDAMSRVCNLLASHADLPDASLFEWFEYVRFAVGIAFARA